MLRLTREVRFAIRPDGTLPPDGRNGFAGRPSLEGLGLHLVLRVTLAGDIDPATGYLRNIVEVDRDVRSRAVPVVQRFLVEKRWHERTALVLALRESLSDSTAQLDAIELCFSPFLRCSTHTREPGMVRTHQRFEFSAAHRLHNPKLSDEQNRAAFGKCNNPLGHGHNYELEIELVGAGRSTSEVEQLVERHAIEPLDHKHLNQEVPEFATLNPSVENIANVIFTRLKPYLSELAAVRVWETPKTWAEWRE
ncbi:MAG: 6-carboxytetrahydropterin synthase [Tepidisphaeraceae bacterium]